MTHNGLKHIFKHVFEKCNKDGFLTPPKSVTNVTLFFEGFPYKKEIGKMSSPSPYDILTYFFHKKNPFATIFYITYDTKMPGRFYFTGRFKTFVTILCHIGSIKTFLMKSEKPSLYIINMPICWFLVVPFLESLSWSNIVLNLFRYVYYGLAHSVFHHKYWVKNWDGYDIPHQNLVFWDVKIEYCTYVGRAAGRPALPAWPCQHSVVL